MRQKFIEKNVPENIRVEVHHRHLAGHPKASYMTFCRLRDRKSGEIVAEGVSACSLKDQPSRKVGRAIAVGRALKRYEMGNIPF